jgi:ATP-dependent Clp protease ATP-binding subunit ClpC
VGLGFKSQKDEMTYQETKEKLLEETKRAFKPEFLNRIDDIIVFHPLTKEDLQAIIEIEVGDVTKRLSEQNIYLELAKSAKEFLIEKGFDPIFGARPLKRTIQRYLEDPLAEEIISGHFKDAKKIKVDFERDHLKFDKV